MQLIRNGKIHDAVHPRPYIADILVDGGKIVKIGKNIDAECDVIDAKGYDLWPGFIDTHTHIGMFGYGGKGAWTKDDVEFYRRCMPENRGIDCLNPREDSFEHALHAGVTAVCTGPGSVNCIGGTHAVVKTYGGRIDDMIVKDPAAMKIAFGENPKSTLKAQLSTRMTVAAEIRTELQRAKEYMGAKDEASANGTKTFSWFTHSRSLTGSRRTIPFEVGTVFIFVPGRMSMRTSTPFVARSARIVRMQPPG